MWFLYFIIVVLFVLAVTDLVVGVSNDAVNFLNSAIGSQVASFRTIILIASLGVIAGAVFSSGIMEVARTGIFRPQFFTLDKILMVFLAVMLTDVVLLDVFNTLGLPTSTTVSVVFELLGASLMAGILFTFEKQDSAGTMLQYINTSGVFTIVSGIFLSIFIAFSSGTAVQYCCRLLFTFRYERRVERYGAVFAGAGGAAIIYFLLIKGLRGTTLVSDAVSVWVSNHLLLLMTGMFAGISILAFILQRVWQVNPLRLVVLLGTFSLAMAFAGNDLVNFIGVPITGYLAFVHWYGSGIPAENFYMDYLAGNDVVVPNYMLLLAGIIMAVTLWVSSKARNVTETEVKLASQQDGDERFQPNAVSRSIVKTSLLMASFFRLLVPRTVRRHYDLSFEKSRMRQATLVLNKPAFDLVRASVNLVLASSIIAVATSYKLPLSTTYVSFMVAMGTSLADKAWGRETAVYRVAGVLSVVGGWLITALIAFGVSALFVFILIQGGVVGSFLLLSFVFIYIILSHIFFAREVQQRSRQSKRLELLQESDKDIYSASRVKVAGHLRVVARHYDNILQALSRFDPDAADSEYRVLQELEQYGIKLRSQSIRYIKNLTVNDTRSAQVLLYSSDLMEDLLSSLVKLGEECRHYIHNLHEEPHADFVRISEELRFKMQAFLQLVVRTVEVADFENLQKVKTVRDDARNFINDQLDRCMRSIQHDKPATRYAVLQTTVLLQSRDILAVTLRIFQLYRKYEKL